MRTKADVRRAFLDARRNMSPEDVAAKSRAVVARLNALPAFRSVASVLCYVSSKDNEVNTRGLIERVLAEGREVLVPIAEPDHTLSWSRLLRLDELVPSRFDILEPRPDRRRITPPPADGLVIVPGIAFTRDGFRIGYGGGYYDRFLAHHRGLKIALAFEQQIVPAFEQSPHDVPVDVVVTEAYFYERVLP